MADLHANPFVRGERVYLRPLDREDLELTIPAINDREIAHLTGFRQPIGKISAERFFEEISKKHGESAYFFAICTLDSGDLVGECSYHRVSEDRIRAEVGIFLLPAFVGKGFGTDAVNALVDFGFGELPLARIELHVAPENARAIRSYEKCGFQREGVLRAYRQHRGRLEDDLLMSITRPEWEALERPRAWDYPAPEPRRSTKSTRR